MDIPHFNYYKILLLMAGLWPYEQSKLTQCQRILFSCILSFYILFQLTTFLTSECTPDLIINVLSFVFPFAMTVSTYNSFWMNMDTLKYLLDELRLIYNELKDNNEIAIIKRHGSKSHGIAIQLTIFFFNIYLVLLFWQLKPIIFVRQLNKSQLRLLPIHTEYFINQQKYFYLYPLHMNAANIIGLIVALSIAIFFLVYLVNVCGIFTVVSYRLKKAMAINNLQNINPGMEKIISKHISYAVDIHCKAMTLTNLLISSLRGTCLFIIAAAVAIVTFNIYSISKAMLSGNIEESLWHFLILCCMVINMFLCTSIGQEVMDYNNDIYATAYNVEWYKAPVRIQKLILFLLQRGSKVFAINVGIFVVSLEYFATLLSISVSYFTTLYVLQS